MVCVDSREDFEARRAEDTLDFPTKASVKVIRKPAALQTSANQGSAGKPARIQCYIVEATEEIEDTPSQSSMTLIRLLEQKEVRADACAPAALSMIQKDPHYGLAVSYNIENQVYKNDAPEPSYLFLQPLPPNRPR